MLRRRLLLFAILSALPIVTLEFVLIAWSEGDFFFSSAVLGGTLVPLVAAAATLFVIERAKELAFSVTPARGGFFARTPTSTRFVAYEELGKLDVDETLKPARRHLVATSRIGQELVRLRILTAAQSRDAGIARDEFARWTSAPDPTPSALIAVCARRGRPLLEWLEATARRLAPRHVSESYRNPEWTDAELTDTLGSDRCPIETRAAVVFALLRRRDAARDESVRAALSDHFPPLVLAAVELARPGEGFVSSEELELARACLAPEDQAVSLRAAPPVTRARVSEGPRVRVELDPCVPAAAGAEESEVVSQSPGLERPGKRMV